MSAALQPFLISEFKTGITNYLEPWIRPNDAFEPLVNAYTYRGVVTKRAGYTPFGAALPDGNPVMGIMQYINQVTGAISLIVASTVNLYFYNVSGNDYVLVASHPTFTGNITNFFNFTNWQASDGANSYLWMVNNKDPVTNVTTQTGPPPFVANQPTITIDGMGTTITTALDVAVYKQRLLLILPTLSSGGAQNQSIYWSAIADPTTWRVDIAGQGGFLAAPTGDIIQSAEFIRDVLVVFFSKSTWIFRYTGDTTAPFRWDKISDTKSINSPYGSVAYDERVTAIGNTGFIATDGVNVQRYDTSIIDYYETNFSEQYFSQAFAQRYDNLNQSWTLYVSNENPFPVVGPAPGSDSALIYNFLENSWATYTFSDPLTCLGIFYNPTGDTWASTAQSWESTQEAWNAYTNQKQAPILLAGDTTGNVYFMDDDSSTTDNGDPINVDIVSTRWNPILNIGQKVQFPYIDIYYRIVSTDPNNPISVTLNFYADNSENIALSRTLTLDGPVGSEVAFKRIYMNLVGEFVQMEIDPDDNANMEFLGFILWARPAGRMTGPGGAALPT